MDLIALILSLVSLVGLVVAGSILRGYLPSYIAEKGKNAASKEDLAELTNQVEKVKLLHAAELEGVKAALLSDGQVAERRRRIYEEVGAALRVFIAGNGSTSEAKERFYEAYAAAWLWASDDVLRALNHFVKLLIQHGASQGSAEQAEKSNAYAAIIFAMRKDAGFSGTNVQASDYQFVQIA